MSKYEEALERARMYHDNAKEAGDYSAVARYENIFPELAESEDERIRKQLIEYLESDRDSQRCQDLSFYEDALAYLEKQKDSDKAMYAIEKIDKYIDSHTANAHDMDDSNPYKKYYCGLDDALGKISGILQDVYSDKEQKEQKLTEWTLPKDFEEAVYKVANFISPFDSQEELRKVSHRFAEQLLSLAKKELDKPAEWSEEDEKNFEAVRKAIFCCNFGVDGVDGKEIGLIEWLKSLRPQPKEEWTEEDEKKLASAISHIEDSQCFDHFHNISKEDIIQWLLSRFKSLSPKPHWKPSEEPDEEPFEDLKKL